MRSEVITFFILPFFGHVNLALKNDWLVDKKVF